MLRSISYIDNVDIIKLMKDLTGHKQSMVKLEFKSLQDKEYMGHSTETETAQARSETVC